MSLSTYLLSSSYKKKIFVSYNSESPSSLMLLEAGPPGAVLMHFIRFKKNNIFNRSFLENQLLNNFYQYWKPTYQDRILLLLFFKNILIFYTVNHSIRNAYMKGQDVFPDTFREICLKYQNIKWLLSGILLSYIISFITFEYVFFSFSPKYLILTQTTVCKCPTMSIFIVFLQKLIHTGKNVQQIPITIMGTLYCFQ